MFSSAAQEFSAQGGAGGTQWGHELLPLKVAPIQPSVTAAFHLQSRRDSDCQMWEFIEVVYAYKIFQERSISNKYCWNIISISINIEVAAPIVKCFQKRQIPVVIQPV